MKHGRCYCSPLSESVFHTVIYSADSMAASVVLSSDDDPTEVDEEAFEGRLRRRKNVRMGDCEPSRMLGEEAPAIE